jgi:hypothetical protein
LLLKKIARLISTRENPTMKNKIARFIACSLLLMRWIGHSAEGAGIVVEDFDTTWDASAWQFSNGPEFPGAKGSFERSKAAAHGGLFGGQLSFDFSAGGNCQGRNDSGGNVAV